MTEKNQNTMEKPVQLPPEIWEIVFQHLPSSKLLKIRLVCRHWRDIVDGCSKLMEKFILKFPKNITFNKRYNPKCLFYKVSGVTFDNVNIVSIPAWWSLFGQNLVKLETQFSETSLPTLLEMLRQTPNLKHLKLFCVKLTKVGGIVPNFQLNQLEKLYINSVCEINILDIFGQICPNLKDFYLFMMQQENANHDEQVVIQFVRRIQKTLQSIELNTTRNFFAELGSFEELRLKRLVYNWVVEPAEQLVDFCRTQPHIEELTVAQTFLTDASLCAVGRNLPNLKRLSTKFKPDISNRPSFLATMVNLERLCLVNHYGEVDFSGYESPNLKVLYLGYMTLTRNSLRQYLAGCPNLHTITMEKCTFHSWSEIFNPIGSLQLLNYLELASPVVQNQTEPNFGPMAKLHRLTLSGFEMPNPVMAALFQACNQLTVIELNGWAVDEEKALEFAQQAGREWRTLTLGVKVETEDCSEVQVEESGVSESHQGTSLVEDLGILERIRISFGRVFGNFNGNR